MTREIWRPIKKFEPLIHHDYYDDTTQTGYLVSSLGRVKRRYRRYEVRNENDRVIYPNDSQYEKYADMGKWIYSESLVQGSLIQMNKKDPTDNYRHYRLSRWFQFGIDSYEFYYGHILVAAAFISKKYAENLEINHKDGNKDNNALSNLEFITHQENMDHAYKILDHMPFFGKSLSDEEKLLAIKNRKGSSLSLDNIYRIRRIYDRGNLTKHNRKLIAEHLGYTTTAIQQIAERSKYGFIREEISQ